MFTSARLKTQAKNLGQFLAGKGITLQRNEMLEALAFVHGAPNWQTLRTIEAEDTAPQDAAAVETVSAASLWQLSSGGTFDRRSAWYQGLNEATALAQQSVEAGIETLVWARNEAGVTHCVALAPVEVPDDALAAQEQVTLLDGSTATWSLENNLSDRWGGLNDYALSFKPSLDEVTAELWSRLASQLVDETSFIARLDDVWGVLVEVELQCWESDGGESGNQDEGLKPEDTFDKVVADVTAKLVSERVEHRFPQVRFAMASDDALIDGRPGVWAFLPDGATTKEQRDELASVLLSL